MIFSLQFCIIGFCILLITLLLLKYFLKLTNGWCYSPVCLLDKTVIITGCNRGIGFETALNLATRGCRVIIADVEDGEETKQKIIRLTHNPNITYKHLDLASFSSIRKFAKEIYETESRLDILINNAGINALTTKVTEDGLNLGMQVNYYGPFLLTYLLTDLLKQSSPSRIIFVASCMAILSNLPLKVLKKTYFKENQVFYNYGHSKLCNIIAAKVLAEKLRPYKVSVFSLHPGFIYTSIFNNTKFNYLFYFLSFFISKSVREGAQTSLHLATSDDVLKDSGKFFWDCKPFFMPLIAKNDDFCKKVWEISEENVKLSPEEKI